MLHIGTAGVPLSTESRDTLAGIAQVRKLGLDAMELEFVRQVYVKHDKDALEICEHAKREKVALSIHAPYFINLNSPDKQTLEESRRRIISCAHVGHIAGARNVVIHSAFYMKMDKEEAYRRIKGQYALLRKELIDKGYDSIILRPELMGKPSQFGDVDALVRLCSEVEGVLPCIDFAHYVALHNGEKNGYDAFCEVMDKVEMLGKEALKDMHIHFSGIEYGDKGERSHLVLDEKPHNNKPIIQWRDMVKAWKDYKIGGIAISESPNIEGDAIKVKKYYDSL
ncbi:MAG: TIM barrel protein [Candidatus Micrarchaeota archaeon]|nr:TIM barrel protein [Candidatus Micrarchaeota archaeon]